MQYTRIAIMFATCYWLALSCINGESIDREIGDRLQLPTSTAVEDRKEENLIPHAREKRTILLKKKILGAGLLGFGLGAVKGYKLGYYIANNGGRISLPIATTKYIRYVEKPVYLQKIIEKPIHFERDASSIGASSYGRTW